MCLRLSGRLLSSFRFCINSKGVNKHYVDHMRKVTKVLQTLRPSDCCAVLCFSVLLCAVLSWLESIRVCVPSPHTAIP